MKNISTLLTIATFTSLAVIALNASAATAGTPSTASASAAATSPTGVASAPHDNGAPIKAKAAPTGEKTKSPASVKHNAAASTSHTTEIKK